MQKSAFFFYTRERQPTRGCRHSGHFALSPCCCLRRSMHVEQNLACPPDCTHAAHIPANETCESKRWKIQFSMWKKCMIRSIRTRKEHAVARPVVADGALHLPLQRFELRLDDREFCLCVSCFLNHSFIVLFVRRASFLQFPHGNLHRPEELALREKLGAFRWTWQRYGDLVRRTRCRTSD